jgi:hypothetical protein
MKKIVMSVLLLLTTVCSAQTSYTNIEQIIEKANSGDLPAINLLGNIYSSGSQNLNVKKDLNEAKKWFELGASKGYPSSYFNLGLMFERGEVVPKDEAKSIELYKKSASLGNKSAQAKLEKLGIPVEMAAQTGAQSQTSTVNTTNSNSAATARSTGGQTITAIRVYKAIELKDGGRFQQASSNAICISDPKTEESIFRMHLGYLGSKEVAQWIDQQDRLENNNNQSDRWSHIRVGKEIFNDMNKFYSTCRYYVGMGDVKAFREFAQEQEKSLRIYPSTGPGRPISVGPALDVATSRQAYAASNGYQNWDEVQLAILVGGPDGDKATVSTMKGFGINNAKDYQDAVSRMNSTNYSNESKPNVNLISNFLKDEQDAKKKGVGVLAMKAEREKKEIAAKQAQDAKADSERKARLEAKAKEFPYEAVLTCGMPDHINILACFAKSGYGVDTELTLRNGNSTNMYKAYNLLNTGVEQRDGFHIDLRPGSALTAQNAHKTLILGLKVYDRRTGKLLMGNQVAQFGMVSFKGQ